MTVFDFKEPEGVPGWLIRFMVRITRPYGVTRDLAERHPWESMERYFSEVEVQDCYFGFLYLAVGKGNEW